MPVLFTSSEKVGAGPGSHSTGSPGQEVLSTQGRSTEGQAEARGKVGMILSESQGLEAWVMESSLTHPLTRSLIHSLLSSSYVPGYVLDLNVNPGCVTLHKSLCLDEPVCPEL